MEQLSLDGTSVSVGRQAPRQDAALALLAKHPEGCSADEIGAAIHGSSGKHDPESICKWCGPDARPVILALIKKKLVTRAGSGMFVLVSAKETDAAFGELPEGF